MLIATVKYRNCEKAGIYATIAIALKGGTWREASMVMMAQTLALEPVRHEPKHIHLKLASDIRVARTGGTKMSESIRNMRNLLRTTSTRGKADHSPRERQEVQLASRIVVV